MEQPPDDPAVTRRQVLWASGSVAVAGLLVGARSDRTAPATAGGVPEGLDVRELGLAGDGETDDAEALNGLVYGSGDGSGPVRFEAGKTYRARSTVTITRPTDLNGATLHVTGRVQVRSGVTVWGGTVVVTDKLEVEEGAVDVSLDRLEVVTTPGGTGIHALGCTRLRITRCRFRGSGARGIVLDGCDDFTVSHNLIAGLTSPDAYAILVAGRPGQMHGGGSIDSNSIEACYFGICLNGGEADPGKPGFARDETLSRIVVSRNRIDASAAPEVLVGGIWATRSTDVDVTHNHVVGGRDVGIDFEYCSRSSAVDNRVTDVALGGLAALFRSTDILFERNQVTFRRSRDRRSRSTGVEWENTCCLPVLLRDDPTRITLRGNTFSVENGALGRLDLGQASTGVTLAMNTLRNCYVSGANQARGGVSDMLIADNTFRFDVNVNNPVIYHERVLRFHVLRNLIRLADGERLPEGTRQYVTVYDGDGSGGTSDYVYLMDNILEDRIGQGIVVASPNTSMHAWIVGNTADRISMFWNGGAVHEHLTYDRNYGFTRPGPVPLTAHDDAGLVLTTVPPD